MDRLLPDGTRPSEAFSRAKVRFTPEEDAKLKRFVQKSGKKVDWKKISVLMKTKSPRQCRERYNNYLKPDETTSPWSSEEDTLILKKYTEVGSKWIEIAKCVTGRAPNSVRIRVRELVKHPGSYQTMISSNINETSILSERKPVLTAHSFSGINSSEEDFSSPLLPLADTSRFTEGFYYDEEFGCCY